MVEVVVVQVLVDQVVLVEVERAMELLHYHMVDKEHTDKVMLVVLVEILH